MQLRCQASSKRTRDKSTGGGQYDAHHIVMSNSKDARMIALRKKMDELDIDINDKRNGIWLPNTESARVPGTTATLTKVRVCTAKPISNMSLISFP